ncbi:hypothetical protein LVD17_05300 [Fulvivirga ulvae]|uniref:hypothetical protein n=1 Tax=Fulvivirga ulvae TaxID=2904245 RepID=UPI001F2BFBB6|nr:hypothetical protein [Fulvivirga ulvae]UII33239.1 hypothetical protein LVD17_05300 [Fulvivirga ulvae]
MIYANAIRVTALLLISLVFSSYKVVGELQETEKYVMVYVEDRGRQKTISINRAGADPDISIIKVDQKEDYTQVVEILEKLNAEGYILLIALSLG